MRYDTCQFCVHYEQPKGGVGNFGLCTLCYELVLGELDGCEEFDDGIGFVPDDDVVLDEKEW